MKNENINRTNLLLILKHKNYKRTWNFEAISIDDMEVNEYEILYSFRFKYPGRSSNDRLYNGSISILDYEKELSEVQIFKREEKLKRILNK